MTFWILLAVAGLLSIFSFRERRNALLSIVSAISWFVIMAFNITNPPAGIVQGTFIHQGLLLIFVGMGIVMLVTYFRYRGNANSPDYNTDANRNYTNEKNYKEGEYSGSYGVNRQPRKSLMDMSPDEYQIYVNRLTHPPKQRR